MQINKLRYTSIIIVSFIGLIGFLPSCANTTAPPSGGEKDTLAPILLKVDPDSNKVNFPLRGQKVEMKFDEFVVLKEPEKNIVVSPPVKRRIETKVRGKSIISQFADSLKKNTTYSISFNNSIADNNEGNLFNPYRYIFSTGDSIDSLIATANIADATTLLPLPGITIAFYENHSDSVIYNTLPSAISKSDKWGHFIITNLKPVPYRVIAFSDENGNNIYNPENEKLAFLDSLYTPTKVMKNGMDELAYIDPRDTTSSLARISDFRLYLFREVASRQFIRNYERLSERECYIKFNAHNVVIDSIGFTELDSSNVIKHFNITKDSLTLWIKGDTRRIPDTLNLNLSYMKTDSLDNLVRERESLRFVLPRKSRQQEQRERERAKNIRTNLLDLKVDANPALVEKEGYRLIFPAPIEDVIRDSIKFISVTPKGIEAAESYKLIADSLELRNYTVKPVNSLQQGYDYILSIDGRAFTDISGNYNDSTGIKVTLPRSEKMGRIDLDIKGTEGSSYVIELINQSRDKVFRSYRITTDKILDFPYLDPGKYSIRVFKDTNNNGILDSGLLKERRQPEMVRLYQLPSGTEIIDIKEGMELSQIIDLKEIFR
ncbi:MAG: Ig-like domain-containing protein [Bacteroidales bacterium]|jgi:hypothetical protein|nr:Ig-like domain-containing protein [Bacteroidales bacterium]